MEQGGLMPVHDDILVAKLRPGQEISCEVISKRWLLHA